MSEAIYKVVIFMLGFIIWRLYIDRRVDRKIAKLERELERNKAVYWFRQFWLETNKEAYDSFPSYKEMLESKLPITEENFIKSNK